MRRKSIKSGVARSGVRMPCEATEGSPLGPGRGGTGLKSLSSSCRVVCAAIGSFTGKDRGRSVVSVGWSACGQ